MHIEEPPALTIWGKADPKVFPILGRTNDNAGNQVWLFIDYAAATIPLDIEFAANWPDKKGTSIHRNFQLRVLECLNSSGQNYPEIPMGHKSLSKIEFHPYIPDEIDNLPTLMGWGYSKEKIKLDLTELK